MSTHAIETMDEGELARLDGDREAGFGALATERGTLPLAAMEVFARAVGLSSSVELRQTFVNTLDEPLEATYIFPLPDRAAVTSFRLEVAGRVIDGVIKERGEARRDYDAAIDAGHRAAIAEEERSGVFTMRVGNLPAGERAVVQLRLAGRLPLEEGDVTFRFPLVVAPRYIPGAPLSGGPVGDGVAADTDAVPDASRISPPVLLPGYPNPVRLSIRLEVDPSGLPLSRLRSSLHAVNRTARGGVTAVTLEPGERLDRDFIVRWSLGDEGLRTGLALARDAEGPGGTFALTVTPPAGAAAAPRPRDVVFVLDRSGSMAGWKMIAARRAAARMVDTLTDADRFAVLAFDNVVDTPDGLPAGALAAGSDRNRFRAVEFLAALEARGGTEMARPLEAAAELLGGGYRDRERVLVLVTDGQVGNEDQILRRLGERLRGARIFTLGIDRAVNKGFLERLAALGAGACSLVESEDRLDEVLAHIHRRIGTPVLTELALEPLGLEIEPDSVVPKRLPDLMAGAPVVITGRFAGPAEGGLRLRGADASGATMSEEVVGRACEGANLAAVWARGMVRQLEDRYVLGRGDVAALERRIVETSLRFSVLCRFTAFVAIDDAEVIDRGGELHRVTQPVQMPSAWAMPMSAPPPSGAPLSMPMFAAADGAGPFASSGGAPPAPKAPRRRRTTGAMGMAGRASDLLDDAEEAEQAEEPDVGGRAEGGAARGRLVAARDALAAELSAGVADPAARAQRLATELTAMADDLASANIAADIVVALRRLVEALRSSGDASAALQRALESLATLLGPEPDGGGAPPRRRAFWK